MRKLSPLKHREAGIAEHPEGVLTPEKHSEIHGDITEEGNTRKSDSAQTDVEITEPQEIEDTQQPYN